MIWWLRALGCRPEVPVLHGNPILSVSPNVPSTIPCWRTGAMRSPGALQSHENFFSLSRFISPIKPLLHCERYLSFT
jgi:hypothetical protein